MKKENNPQKVWKILFVCLGNICRSPAAEGVMQALVEQRGVAHRFVIDSAGIGGWHVGDLPDHRMRTTAARHGYNLTSRARQVKPYDFQDFDLIVCMDEENRYDLIQRSPTTEGEQKIRMLADYLPKALGIREIGDPYYGGQQGFERVFTQIEMACERLLESLIASPQP